MGPCNAAKAACHPRFHSKPWKFVDDLLHLIGRNKVILQADHIKANTGSAQRNFSFLVEAYRGRRVEGDAIPDQLTSTLIETDICCKAPGEIRALNFETARAGEVLVKCDVMQQGSYGDDFCVVFNPLELSDPRCKEPGADNVVEQVGFAFLPGILHCPVNHWRRCNLYSCQGATIHQLCVHAGSL